MPRQGTLAADIAEYLKNQHTGATVEQITNALGEVRRTTVLPHSVRSALYQHLGDSGDCLFIRLGRGRYELKKSVCPR